MRSRDGSIVLVVLAVLCLVAVGCDTGTPQKVRSSSAAQQHDQGGAILGSDDPTSVGALSFIKDSFVDVEVEEIKLVGDFDEWKAAVERYNGCVDALAIYRYHTVTEKGSAERLEPKLVMAWTAQHATVPTLGFFDFGIEDGLLLGVVESGFEHGEKAARYALAILSGTPVSSLPITRANVGVMMLNTETAERLGLRVTSDTGNGVRLVP